jgi:Astacin (Peptidase family M12A)
LSDFYFEFRFVFPDKKNQFLKYSHAKINAFGQPYDFDSIMHYPANAFAKDAAKPTIKPKEKYRDKAIGQQRGLSSIDVKKINLMYNCPPVVVPAPNVNHNLINLTISWTILGNFESYLSGPSLFSPLVNSKEIGLIDADGDWFILVVPKYTENSSPHISAYIGRINSSKGNATAVALSIQ